MNWIDWFGYGASFVILISLTMVSIIKLRVINFIGCLLFAVFGFMIHSYPTAFMNVGIAVINIYFLYGMIKKKEEFKLIKISRNSQYFQHFIDVNKVDLKKQIRLEELDEIKEAGENYYILRDNNIAGVILGEIEGNVFDLKVDYVTPRYRDSKLGKYFFCEKLDFFKEKNIDTITAKGRTKDHSSYLEKIGFKKVEGMSYIKNI